MEPGVELVRLTQEQIRPAAPVVQGADEESINLTPGVVWTHTQLDVIRDLLARNARLLAERDQLDRMLREAGIEYPTGPRAVSDLIDQRDGQRQRAEEAEAERDQVQARVAELEGLVARNHPAYLSIQGIDPDGSA